MSPFPATIVFTLGVSGLFLLNRRDAMGGSVALWLPTIWLFFCSSRSPAYWMGFTLPTEDPTATYMQGSPFDRAIFLAIEALAIIVVANRRTRAFQILRNNWAIGLFFAYAAFSISWSDFPLVTLKHWIKGIGDVVMLLIVLTERDIPAAVTRLIVRLGFVLIPLSLLLIWYFPSLGRTHTMNWTPEAVGVATQKNGLGELCDFFGLGLVWRLRAALNDRKSPDRKKRIFAIAAILCISVWLLHLSNSLTSIAALTMSGSVMLLSASRTCRDKRAYVHILVAGVMLGTLYALFFQSSGYLVQSLGRNPTLTGRVTIWPKLLHLVGHLLIGVGYESFWLGYRLQDVWAITQGLLINEAHSGYVEILLTMGWVGATLLGLLIAGGYQTIIRVYRRDPDVGSLRLAWFLAVLITGLTEAAFRMMGLPWLIFLLVTTAAPWSGSVSRRIRVRPAGASQAHLNVAEGDHVIADVKSKVQTVI